MQIRALKLTKWILAWTSAMTLLMSPLAQGAQASREATQVSKQQMQNYIDQLGLNHQITLGEFYKRNKNLFPPRIQREVEPMFMANKNMLMPTFEVTSSKNTLGEEVPGIRLSQNGELINMQWFGETDRLVKIQNTNLSQVDVVNFDDMFLRLLAGDEKFRKQSEPKPDPGAKFRNLNYPTVNEAEWKSMSAMDKANYIVNMRQLWQDARRINAQSEALKAPAKAKKTSSFNFFEQNKFFAQLFLGSEACAATDIVIEGQTCIIAGYTSKYKQVGKSKVCSVDSIDEVYGSYKNQIYQTAKSQCSGGQIACNPYVYGAPNGHAICVTPGQNEGFQKATSWGGDCDSQAQLSTTKIEAVTDKNKADRYGGGNLRSEADRRAQAKTEQEANNFAQTKTYLLGVLKLAGKVSGDATEATVFDGPISNEVFTQVVSFTKADFESEISRATQTCHDESSASASGSRSHERNYWGACDQLHSRFLFVAEILSKKCTAPQTFDNASMKCSCPAGAAAVIPGAACGTGTPAAPAAPAHPAAAPVPAVAPAPAAPAAPAHVADASIDDARPSRAPKKEGSSLFDKIWKGVTAVAPYVLAGGVAYLLLKMMSPKKATQVAAADLCPGTTTPAPCAQVCTAPLAPNGSGVCACPACPPGQVASAACVCGSSTTTTDPTVIASTYTCPDAVTKVSDLNSCPTYSCWNGSSYQNPMNCPTQSPTTTSTTAPTSTTTSPVTTPSTGR